MAEKKKEKKGFFGHWLVRNLMAMAILGVVLIVGAMVFLNIATQHNRELEVPDFRGMTVEQAFAAAEDAGIRVEIIDSVYSQRNRGKVKSHNPAAGVKVKKGRRVLLTVNAVNARKVSVPNLVGYSLRQAMPELEQRGLGLGRLIYKDDIATNNVLQQQYRGREVSAGTLVEAESVIDLVLGLNHADSSTVIPSVLGKDEKAALRTLHDSYLNVSEVIYDKDVQTWEDSLAAQVYKQEPEPSDTVFVCMGTDITIFLKKAAAEE